MTQPTHSPEYLAYLRSPEWAAQRQAALERADNKCESGCGARATEVNHKTYTRLGRERPGDLEALCHHCHIVADYERQQYGTPEQRRDRYWSRLRGWAQKVYGEDWEDYDPEIVEEQFQEWLERREPHDGDYDWPWNEDY